VVFMLTGDDIRSQFLAFFEEHGHKVIPSSSLIPHGDPTLLLTTAGMVQLKPYFMGQAAPPAGRLASVQKCFRTTDIESVGDASHLTFFEMLGNFSVGDYFKKEAIALAWELLVQRFGLPKDRLWTTVYLDDDDAFALWRDMIGVPEKRIVRLGEADNFWGPAGDSGPCGPCSEIHYDFGEDVGCRQDTCNPACKCGRFCEIWNLVFMQFNQDTAGRRTLLPRPNIDTGMGLERITAVLQGKSTVYKTDIFQPLLKRAAELSGQTYGQDEETDRALRVIAEHGRGVPFLITDGVLPSNEGRGYVLRRLLRRAALFGRRLGLDRPFLVDMAATAIEHMNRAYPELIKRRDFVLDVIRHEEERFDETLSTGLALLDDIIAQPENQVRQVVPGAQAFKLYDTYGFPVELTREVALSRGLNVDMAGFEAEMAKQRAKARASHKFGGGETAARRQAAFEPTRFTGYAKLLESSRILGLIVANEDTEKIDQGQEAGMVLENTPFYAEMGGQLGDTGWIKGEGGIFAVTNTIKLDAHTTFHQGYTTEGSLAVGDPITAEVNAERRADIARNHTATHLLQYALRRVLGEHVQQRGSLVAPERLRFDFSHLSPLGPEQLAQVQDIVNYEIRANHPVYDRQMPYKEAIVSGAIALFDEKYGDTVRVLSVGRPPISTELCGGTHIAATGEIGFMQIVTETSIGAGLRRIEAVTGREAARLASFDYNTIQTLARLLETTPESVLAKVQVLQAERDQQVKRAEALERILALKDVDSLLDMVQEVGGVKLLAVRVKPTRPEILRDLAETLHGELAGGIVVLGTVHDDKPFFIVSVAPELVAKGYHAGHLIRQIGAITGGGGGGRPNFALGGGKDASKLDEALASVPGLLKK
jgi:alanyl-tRNA synthetase